MQSHEYVRLPIQHVHAHLCVVQLAFVGILILPIIATELVAEEPAEFKLEIESVLIFLCLGALMDRKWRRVGSGRVCSNKNHLLEIDDS